MLFNSLSYAIFLPIIFALYWLLPQKFKWILLFVSSYYFYMSWNPKYVILILGTTAISYFAALLLEKCNTVKQKKGILLGTVVVCIGVLFFFKYLNFALDSLSSVLRLFSIQLHPLVSNLLLPVGISFYTFQTMSYVIDVYRGDVKAERHFGYYATFISFFPQLVAGPIERTNNLLPQIVNPPKFDERKASNGLHKILWGFFKKAAVADTLAQYVDAFYGDINGHAGFAAVIAIFFFTVQIYCDFSGYSDIAIGSANLLGIDLMENFKCPYFSTSIHEFWKRWHISLSTWFRDYVYIPLGGNRCSKLRQKINLLVTFLVSGLWHGANWTFVIWGSLHGFAQIIENLLKKPLQRIKKKKIGVILSGLFVFLFCNITWVFFRAESFSDAITVFSKIFVGISQPIQYLKAGLNGLSIGKSTLVMICSMLFILMIGDYIHIKEKRRFSLSKFPFICRVLAYIVFVWYILCMIPINGGGEFIYFQF